MHSSSRVAGASLRLGVLLVCAGILLGACGDGSDETSSFLVAQPDTITFHVVHREMESPCPGVPGPNEIEFSLPNEPGSTPRYCVVAGPAEVDATDVVQARVEKHRDPALSVVVMRLSEEAAGALDDMKRRTARGRIATVVEGRLVDVPTYVVGPKSRGVARVTLRAGEAQILADRLKRRASL